MWIWIGMPVKSIEGKFDKRYSKTALTAKPIVPRFYSHFYLTFMTQMKQTEYQMFENTENIIYKYIWMTSSVLKMEKLQISVISHDICDNKHIYSDDWSTKILD